MPAKPKAGSYHIRFPMAVTNWLEEKRKQRGLDYVQDVVRDLVQQAYEAENRMAEVKPLKKAA